MRPELSLLVWAVALTVVQRLIAVTGAFLQVGLPTLAGNREGLPEMKGWAGRAERAHLKMLQNLILFASLVIVAVLANKGNPLRVFGAQLFSWGRLASAV